MRSHEVEDFFLDLGRPPRMVLPDQGAVLFSADPVTQADLDAIYNTIGHANFRTGARIRHRQHAFMCALLATHGIWRQTYDHLHAWGLPCQPSNAPRLLIVDSAPDVGDTAVVCATFNHHPALAMPPPPADNRAGIDGYLHRVSVLRSVRGQPVGFTLRVGRTLKGSAELVTDLAFSGKGLLLVGPPGRGKTTALREISRLLAATGRRVMVVDTSNEIGGDGDVPHRSLGSSRRIQVHERGRQAQVSEGRFCWGRALHRAPGDVACQVWATCTRTATRDMPPCAPRMAHPGDCTARHSYYPRR